jgi:hypothetical protein
VIMINTHVDGSICIDSVGLYPDKGGKLFHNALNACLGPTIAFEGSPKREQTSLHQHDTRTR